MLNESRPVLFILELRRAAVLGFAAHSCAHALPIATRLRFKISRESFIELVHAPSSTRELERSMAVNATVIGELADRFSQGLECMKVRG